MNLFDLHIHSVYSSDGEFAVEDIVGKCVAAGVDVFALTDHNTVRGVPGAADCAKQAGIGFIPGIEIDCNYRGTDLHLLGYGIDHTSDDFSALEAEVRLKTLDSFGAMIDNLLRLGFVVDAGEVLSRAGEQLPSAELIAEVMLSDTKYYSPLLAPYMKGGSRSDMPYINFYLDYFAQGKPAFVPVEYRSFRDAVELVRDNGGVPVVAHPGLNFRGIERVAEQLLQHGAAGLEVFNNYHDPAQTDYFASLALREGAFMTCGSDFHGKTKPLIGIGQFRSDDRYNRYPSDFVNHIDVVRGQGV
ncbi:PHP domain-containing protein [uncultured Alistipes sp.]|jgi:predicted metal-dependent phosphoesterases (PHP family)|uniref:PHP domain-containing protein n=1 Tax=uncultured Alistipes sp. TaxID=538949 RepID=UPI0025EB5F62|nr:PHP domain-containing protein [uncultured Alistipes sp.]